MTLESLRFKRALLVAAIFIPCALLALSRLPPPKKTDFEWPVSGSLKVSNEELRTLAELGKRHALEDVVAHAGPSRLPRTNAGNDPRTWRVKINGIGVFSPPNAYSPCFSRNLVPDSALRPTASVDVEVISTIGLSPESLYLYYYRDTEARWRPGLEETPCAHIITSYYF